MTHSCSICSDNMNITHQINDLTLLCKPCLNSASLYTLSTCKTSFILSSNDIKLLKPVYLFKKIKSNTPKIYLESHVLDLLLSKYANEQNGNLNAILNNKREKLIIRKNKKITMENKRREEIKKEFEINRLEYNEVGDIYLYITTGKPSVAQIINDEIIKLDNENKNRTELAKYLKSINIKYNEYNSEQNKYIKQKDNRIKLSHFKPTDENEFMAHL